MKSRTVPQVLALALFVANAAACYRYIPTQYDVVPVGQAVRVWVGPDVKARIEAAGAIPISDPVLKGTILEKANGGMSLNIPFATRQEGFHSQPIYHRETLTQREIISVEQRVFDRTGTIALTTGTIGGAAFVVFVIMNAYGEAEQPGECEADCTDLMAPTLPRLANPGRRVPLLSIPIPWGFPF